MNKVKVNALIEIVMVLVMVPIFFLKGEWHETIAYVLAGLVLVHIIMHWNQFTGMYRRLVPVLFVRRIVTAILVLLIITAIILPGYMPRGGHGEGHGRPPGQFQRPGY